MKAKQLTKGNSVPGTSNVDEEERSFLAGGSMEPARSTAEEGHEESEVEDEDDSRKDNSDDVTHQAHIISPDNY